jgi:hypothetical protein
MQLGYHCQEHQGSMHTSFAATANEVEGGPGAGAISFLAGLSTSQGAYQLSAVTRPGPF